jgi:DNA-binding transcriptional regulator GbsR (MarR family)
MMDSETSRFTDRLALLFESDGLPPIAGRIFGLLLLSDDALSLDELAEDLAVSKASASTNARLLAQIGVVEQVRRTGSRRDYYRTATDLFERSMAQRLARWQRFTEAIGEGRRTLPLASAEVRERLERYESAFSYMVDAIGRALAQWRGTPSHSLASTGSGR